MTVIRNAERMGKEERKRRYQLARKRGLSVEWATRVRDWTLPHIMLFLRGREDEGG